MPELSGHNATFKLETNDISALKDDQLLVKTLYLSNDPAQRTWIAADIKPERLYVPPVKPGTTMNAGAVAEVIESKSSNFPKGAWVTAYTGWSEYAVVDALACRPADDLPAGLSITHSLGALGLTGLTAYYGTKEVAGTTEADTLVVSGAAGATGSMVVQIAKKLIGCKSVIGIAGSDDKCKWVESLGADKCLNYKSPTFAEDLEKATDGDVDVYFDNVGGHILDLMLSRMKMHGRVAVCGSISSYNSSAPLQLRNWIDVIAMRIQLRGFIVTDHMQKGKAMETLEVLKRGVQDGKLKIDEESEHIVDAKFEDIPAVWMKLFEGANTGKLITKLI